MIEIFQRGLHLGWIHIPPFVFIGLCALIPFLLLVIIFLARNKRPYTPRWLPNDKITRKQLLTKREQAMFRALSQAFPEHAVLAQISFGALLDARSWATRNRFDRKIADFALCDKDTAKPLLLIELDDHTHWGKRGEDKIRDNMLRKAGYTVVRFDNVPNRQKLREQLARQLS